MKNNKNTGRKLAAGQPGTKKMVDEYGDNLVCVRYKYDSKKKVKYKTVELIVDRGFWDPGILTAKRNRKVDIKITFDEFELRKKIKEAGGIWNKERKVWELSFKSTKELGLRDRMVSKHGE